MYYWRGERTLETNLNSILYVYNCFKVVKFLRCPPVSLGQVGLWSSETKRGQMKRKKTDFSESSKKAERRGAEHTHGRREREREILQKKPARNQVNIRKESTRPNTCPSMGQKNSSRLCRFFDSLVSESSECKSSQQVQKPQQQKDHSKTEENYFTQRSHNIIQQLAVRKWGFLQEGRYQRVTHDDIQ